MRELLKKKPNLQCFVNDKDEIRLMYKKVPIDAVMIPIERSDFMCYISSDVSISIFQSKCWIFLRRECKLDQVSHILKN